MAQFAVILPAAGRSARFNSQKKTSQQNQTSPDLQRPFRGDRKKPFVDLKGRAVWVRAAEQFVHRDDVVQTIIAISPDDMDDFKQKFRPNLAFMNIDIVEGGAERADTVHRALNALRDDVDFVAVHDAARPLIVKEWIDAVFSAAEKTGAAILAIPVSSTLKRATDSQTIGEQTIGETVSREQLWQAQTPQVFRRDWLCDAYAQRGEFQPTDEAQLLETTHKERPISIVNGSPMNIKITTMADLKMAEALLNALPKEKTLRALHPFADEDPHSL